MAVQPPAERMDDVYTACVNGFGGTRFPPGMAERESTVWELDRTWVLRKVLQQMSPVEAMELLREKMVKTSNNEEFLGSMAG